MPIDVALYTKTIGGKQFAFDTGDISFGDAETKDVVKNVGTDILSFSLRKREVTFTIRGANASDLTALFTARDNSINQIVSATEPLTGEDIAIGADTIFSALLVDVQAGPPIKIGDTFLVEETSVVFRSTKFV